MTGAAGCEAAMAGCCTARRKKQGQFWEEAERGVELTGAESSARESSSKLMLKKARNNIE
jgi:hypothetical protein